jgi:hypothetical protein
MRVLASAVLAFEWIVLGLAIPVAINVSDVSGGRAWITFAVATVLCVAALRLLPRPAGVWCGWGVQIVAIGGGLFVPMLAIMGVIFAALYFAALRLGRQVDQAKMNNEAAAAAREQESAR